MGIDVSRVINESFALRVNINGATYNRTATEDDPEYDADLDFANTGVLVDHFPFESIRFQLSSGAYYNGNEITANANQDEYEIGDHTYTSVEIGRLNGKVDFDKFAPFVGVG